jgi:Universal stress protein family
VQTRALFVLPKPEQVGLLPEAGQSDAESLQDRGFDQTSLRDSKKQSPILSIQRIIVAVSLTKDSEATTRYTAEIAKHFNASLYVAYAFWPPPDEFQSEGACNLIARREKQLRANLDELAERMQGLVPECESIFLMGEPAERYQHWRAKYMLILSSPLAIIQGFSCGCSLWIRHPRLCIGLRVPFWCTTTRIYNFRYY